MLKWKYTVRRVSLFMVFYGYGVIYLVIFLSLKSRLRSDFLQEFRTTEIIFSSFEHTLLLSNDNNFRLLKFI